jgi:hypothetical protein
MRFDGSPIMAALAAIALAAQPAHAHGGGIIHLAICGSSAVTTLPLRHKAPSRQQEEPCAMGCHGGMGARRRTPS